MADQVRVQRLLRRISDEVTVLEWEALADDARRQDVMWLRGVKYSFVTAIESCMDVAQHLCAVSGWGPPADNGDAVRLLATHGVLDAELAVSVRQSVGFRNILVYEYADVDDEIVIRRLSSLEPPTAFVAQVAGFIAED
ncbi:type VII toxin-antitoxin system HepT family RNase toxin [Ruania alba]|uniref:Uncharacterized conserved protein YutE, UPF0331/DUF86 family n=1 Tax=Ruania alba TaxID=648782 RepID=A0A1H5L784_9MICO|nr:DUF86 domain-containing protein [Ruania alba]SEE72883.1 Uncharacterized conserved protein YutE, UPF0331/DUF86 family [Ruania alba]